MTRAIAVLITGALCACEPDPLETQWRIDFGDVPPGDVATVAVRILRGDCTTIAGRDAERRRVHLDVFGVGPDGFEPPVGGWSAPLLPDGDYCFVVQARGNDCVQQGSGSTATTLPAPTVEVRLTATPPPEDPTDPGTPGICGCPSDRCLGDGTCDVESGTACPCDAVISERVPDLMINLCNNGIDDDCDTLTDCEDTEDCPRPSEERSCSDTFDDDCDGSTDCDDPDCARTSACSASCPGGRCMPGPGVTETGHCDDGIDNDGDRSADCLDPDCNQAPCDLPSGEKGHCDDCRGNLCVPNREIFCGDGIDDDCDGNIDCRDTWDCRNRLCGASFMEWIGGGRYGNARCCPQAEGPTEDGCVSFGDAATFSCGACETLCEGTAACVRIDPHTAPTHYDSYTCGCGMGTGCPNVRDPLQLGRQAFQCEEGQCHCRYNFACGANAACARGERRHCHPRELNRRTF